MDQMFKLHLHHIRFLHIRRSDFVFCISDVQTSPLYGSDVQTSSASHLLASQIRRSDFAFICIRCSDFICVTFASTAVRRSDFVFCISGAQTSPSYGSDVQTSSASHSLAQQIRRSDFVFNTSGVQTSSSYGSDVYTSSASHLLASQIKRSDFVFCTGVQTSPSLDQMFRLHLYHVC